MFYNNTAFGPPYSRALRINTQVPPCYLFGDLDTRTQPFLFQVTKVALTSGVATLNVTLKSGGGPSRLVLPQVGAKMGVQGTQTDAGLFNVDPTTVTALTFDVATGIGTVSYDVPDSGLATLAIDAAGTGWAVDDEFDIAGGTGGVGKVTAESGGVPSAVAIVTNGYGYSAVTGAATTAVSPSTGTALTVTTTIGAPSDVAGTNDAGNLVVQPYETPDLVSEGSASVAYSQFFGPDEADNARSIYAEAKWGGTLPTTATVVLQISNYPDDSRFAVVENNYGTSPTGTVASSDALATVAAGAVTQSGANYVYCIGKFVRAKVLSMTGGDESTSLVVTIFA